MRNWFVRLVLCAGVGTLLYCGGGAAQSGGSNPTSTPTNVPAGPPGVDYRASCEFQNTGVCVDVFTSGGLDAASALPQGCTRLNDSCRRDTVKGLCKLEQQRGAARVYSEHLFYHSVAGRQVTELCINNSGRLVRYDY